MKSRRMGGYIAIAFVTGALIWLSAEFMLDKVFHSIVSHPARWAAAQRYLEAQIFWGVLRGGALGAVLGTVLFFRAPLKMEVQTTFQGAVDRQHLISGAGAGLVGVFAGIWFTFLALIDNPRPAALCAAIVIVSVMAGAAGGAVAASLVYALTGRKKKPHVNWALLGGFLAGLVGFMLMMMLAYS